MSTGLYLVGAGTHPGQEFPASYRPHVFSTVRSRCRARSNTSFAESGRPGCLPEMIRSGSKSSSAAALLLPSAFRNPAYALYAFCRLSDDLVDVEPGSLEAIAQLRERLELAYEGRPLTAASIVPLRMWSPVSPFPVHCRRR